MRKKVLMASAVAGLAIFSAVAALYGSRALAKEPVSSETELTMEPVADDKGFTVDVLIDGRKTTEYAARGRRYIEALENAEYELRIHNPTASRVAVALSVDGMNTIDARHTSAWDAHKWVIEPYGTISVRGWQMSSSNARRFYFTTERDSYGAKIGQTANLGLISAVFFRERNPIVITPVTPGRRGQNPTINKDEDRREENAPSSAGESTRAGSAKRSANTYPPPDDESAATGIGRSIENGVTWIKMELDSRPVGEITIRYEYRAGLVRLGIIPRDNPRPDVLNRRERAEGFDPKFCPQP